MPVDQTLHECFRRDDKTSWIDTLGFKKRNENVWRENSNLYGYIIFLSLHIHIGVCKLKGKLFIFCNTQCKFLFTLFLFHFYFFFQAKTEAVPLCFLMKKGLHFHVCISDAHSAQKSAKNDFCFMLHFSYSFGYQYYQGPDHLVPIWIDNNENIYAKMILPKIFWNNS